MGSSEVMRNLEVLAMQMRCQAEFAQSGLDLARGSLEHWQAVAASYKSDCEAAMRARASVETFKTAAGIFEDLLDACRHVGRDAEAFEAGE